MIDEQEQLPSQDAAPSIPLGKLDWDDAARLLLQTLYKDNGFTRYRMSSFESYDFYYENKGFLRDSAVITFTDPTGKLMALKPDITLSIINSLTDSCDCQKLFYDESVFRIQAGSSEFSEIAQVGVEYIGEAQGKLRQKADADVMLLALKSMDVLGQNSRLAINHLGLSEQTKQALQNKLGIITPLQEAATVLRDLLAASSNASEADLLARNDLEQLCKALAKENCLHRIFFDPTLEGDTDYYTGISFQGYLEGVAHAVLSGGRYDGLMERFNKTQGGVGFAVYLGEIARNRR